MKLLYFKHFELPLTFEINASKLKNKFYALSKKYHPDFYLNATAEKQQEVLELSTLTNKAYQTLSNPERLLAYILQESGVLQEGEKDTIPSDFLMEMMEFNEELMELEINFDESRYLQIQSQLKVLLNENDIEIQNLTKDFSVKPEEEQISILKKLKESYFKNKYLLRIQKKISIFASRKG